MRNSNSEFHGNMVLAKDGMKTKMQFSLESGQNTQVCSMYLVKYVGSTDTLARESYIYFGREGLQNP